MRPVERRKRNEIERRKHDIDLYRGDQHELEDRGRRRDRLDAGSYHVRDDDKRNAEHRDDEIRRDSGERDDDVALFEIPVIARIDGDGFCSSQYRRARYVKQERQNHRHERIYVLCGIPGQPAELIGRHVAILEGRIAVRVFVGDHREQQNGRDQNEILR